MRAVMVYSRVFGSLIATSLLLVSGCATTTYVPTSNNAQDFDTAKVTCQNDPQIVGYMQSPNQLTGLAVTIAFRDCMREQGWVPQSGNTPQPPQPSSARAPTPKENCYINSKTPGDLQWCLANIDR
jgi:hypothetical protein